MHDTQTTTQTDKPLAALIRVVQEQINVQEAMLDVMQQKRTAIRDGRASAMVAYCRLEEEKLSRLAELEKARLTLVAQLTQQLDPNAQAPMKLGELAEAMPEPIRGQLLVLRQALREKTLALRAETSVARKATQSIVKHMTGLVQTITQAANFNPTYNRQGMAQGAPAAMSTLNLTA